MLTKRTYSVLVLLVALAVPTVALAAPGGSDAQRSRVGIAAVQPQEIELLTRPGERLQRTIRVHVQRIRRERRARLRRERREAFATLPAGVSVATLEAIAACESGGDPTAVSADGSYRGKYQFSFETWAAVGGSGDPAEAPEAEQDYRAALLYAQSGSSPWPVCG